MMPTPAEQLESAEAAVFRTYQAMRDYANSPAKHARAESFRLALNYRNSLLSTDELARMYEATITRGFGAR